VNCCIRRIPANRASMLLATLWLLLWPAPSSGSPATRPRVISVELFEAIQPVTAQYLEDSLRRAARERCALVIVKLDTPGGLVSSAQDMVKAITSSPVPVAVFVSGAHAASAGFFITLAADVAVMAPGTRFGAAHPVGIGGTGDRKGQGAILLQKAESDLAAWVRTLAQNRGRNVTLAEEAVRQSRSFTEKEALKGGLIDFVLPNEKAILGALDGKSIRRFTGQVVTLKLGGARVEQVRMSARERFLSFIADPEYVLFLLILGALGLYVEFTHPGMVFPGVFGALCLLCFAYAIQILPINYVGLLLVVLGVALFILELKVPSHGLLTAGGIAALTLGSLMLFRRPEAVGLSVPLWTVGSVAAGAGLLMAFLTRRVIWAHRQRVTTGGEGLLGELGNAITDLEPEGKVFVHGEIWNARSASPVARGRRVKVVRVQSMMLEVEELRR